MLEFQKYLRRATFSAVSCLMLVMEGLFSITFSLTILFPIFLVGFIINGFIRSIVLFYMNMVRLENLELSTNGLDNIWGYKNFGNSRVVLNLIIYEKRIDGEKYKALFQQNVLNNPSYSKLKKKFTNAYGYYCWKKDLDFDISNHIIILPKEQIVDQVQIQEMLRKYSEDMDSEIYPQWQEIIIPSFQYGPNLQSAKILRFHHAYGDGASWLLLYNNCLANDQIPFAVNPLEAYQVSVVQKIGYYSSALVFGGGILLKRFIHSIFASDRFKIQKYKGSRFYRWNQNPINLDTLKDIKLNTETCIPSIVTSVIATSLARFNNEFPSEKKYVGKTLPTAIVAAILPYEANSLSNQYTIANLNLNTKLEKCREERLAVTHKAILELSRNPEPLINYWCLSFFGLLPILVQNRLLGIFAETSIVFSNLPGSSKKFALADDVIEDGGCWVPLLTTAGISLTANGYNGKIRICGVADENALTEVELEIILEFISEEIKKLHFELCNCI